MSELCVLETMCTDVQMGFCMESGGMTQGGQGEAHADFEPHLKEDVESMEDGQDPEVQIVHCFLIATFSDCYCTKKIIHSLTSLLMSTVWTNDCRDKISKVKK